VDDASKRPSKSMSLTAGQAERARNPLPTNGIQCCFCGMTIVTQTGVSVSVALPDGEATQHLVCHGACFAEALHPSVPAAFAGGAEIFVALLDEGVEVWRPVEARKVGTGVYQISSSIHVPDGEKWAFEPGATVLCERRRFQDGAVALVAVSMA
jgi:hypothetical protein